MINGKKVVVVMPAYNAETTLKQTYSELDLNVIDEVILVDDCSTDETAALAKSLGLQVIRHDDNKGYGGNQKTCYKTALEMGADVIVMLHPDYQYSPRLCTAMAAMIAYDQYDFVLASRILGPGALKGGMPLWKYIANRGLTFAENLIIKYKLSEYHSGYRSYSREVLETLRLEENSDDFVFDNQMIAQALANGFRFGEISCPAKYEENSSSINFRRSVTYGFGVLKTAWQCRMHMSGVKKYSYLLPRDN
jgi:glycosyltransferase involved in cell wall biosynthesis